MSSLVIQQGAWAEGKILQSLGAHGKVTLVDAPEGGGGTVDSVVAGSGITVDATDPANPIVSVSGGGSDPFNVGLSGFWSQATTPGGTSWRITFDDEGSYAPVDVSSNGTSNHPLDTSAATDFNSINYRYTTASAGPANAGGFRSGGSDALHYFKTSAGAAGSGGFKRVITFGVLVQDNDGQAFFGECTVGANPAGAGTDPSAALNIFGFGKDAADANLQFMHNNGAGVAVKVDTGITVASLIGKILRLEIDVPRGGASGTARLIDAGVNTVLAEGTASSELPAVTVSMDWCVSLNNGATSTAVRLGLNSVILGYPD